MAYKYVRTSRGEGEYTHLRVAEDQLDEYLTGNYEESTKEDWLAELQTSADWEAIKANLEAEGELEPSQELQNEPESTETSSDDETPTDGENAAPSEE